MVELNIIQACKRKKHFAYKKMYETCIPYVYSVVSRYVNEKEDKKDLTQEVFAKIFSKINTYEESKGNFKPWLRKITVNECLMYLRAKSKLNIVHENFDMVDKTYTELESLTRQDILNMLDKMPIRYKYVFMAYIIDGLSHKEIAKQLNITADTSRSQLTRAKKWIIKNISKENQIKSYGLF